MSEGPRRNRSELPDDQVWTPENLERFWARESQFPEHYFTFKYGREIASALAPRLSGSRDVLDFGCGAGFLVGPLMAQGFRVTGADLSPRSVEIVNQRYAGNAAFKGASTVENLVRSGQTFDAVVAVEVIEHLDDVALANALHQIKKLLRPGGTAIFTTPNDEDLEASIVHCPRCDAQFHRWQHVRSWTAQSLAGTLGANGFTVDSTYTTNFATTRKSPLQLAATTVRRMFGRAPKHPNLVCVCHVAGKLER